MHPRYSVTKGGMICAAIGGIGNLNANTSHRQKMRDLNYFKTTNVMQLAWHLLGGSLDSAKRTLRVIDGLFCCMSPIDVNLELHGGNEEI